MLPSRLDLRVTDWSRPPFARVGFLALSDCFGQANRREIGRGDRPVGLARSKTAVYGIGESDIVVDTTSTSADDCATAIAYALDALSHPKAFDRRRSRRHS